MDSNTLSLTVMGFSTAAVTVVIILSNNSHSSWRKDPKWPLLAITCVWCQETLRWIANLRTPEIEVNGIAIRQDFKCEFYRLQPNLKCWLGTRARKWILGNGDFLRKFYLGVICAELDDEGSIFGTALQCIRPDKVSISQLLLLWLNANGLYHSCKYTCVGSKTDD